MKKTVVSILGLVFAFSLAGCSQTTVETSPAAETQQEVQQEELQQEESQESEELVLYIVRHGKTLFNEMQLMQGACDSPLIELGIEQAGKVGQALSDIEFAAAYSSDLGRQRDTLKYILAENNNDVPDIQEIIGLREINYGGYEGMPIGDVHIKMAEYLGIPADDYLTHAATLTDEEKTNNMADSDPMGIAESYSEVLERITGVKEHMIENEGGGNILLVSSGGIIQKLLWDLAPNEYQGEGIKNCSITVVRYTDGEFHIELLNDLAHLEN